MSWEIVLLGMITRMPVAGAVWQTLHYMVGLRRLGFEPYYVEAHARTPTMFMPKWRPAPSCVSAAVNRSPAA